MALWKLTLIEIFGINRLEWRPSWRRLNTEVMELTFNWWWDLQDALSSRHYCSVDSTQSRWFQVQTEFGLLVFNKTLGMLLFPFSHVLGRFRDTYRITSSLPWSQSYPWVSVLIQGKVAIFCGVATEDNHPALILPSSPPVGVAHFQDQINIWLEANKLEREHRRNRFILFMVTRLMHLTVTMWQFVLSEVLFFLLLNAGKENCRKPNENLWVPTSWGRHPNRIKAPSALCSTISFWLTLLSSLLLSKEGKTIYSERIPPGWEQMK